MHVQCMRFLEPDQISHIQSMVAKRGLTNQANVHTPMMNKCYKTQHGRILIDPAIMAAIGVSWPSGLAYRTQVLVLAVECGFESRP